MCVTMPDLEPPLEMSGYGPALWYFVKIVLFFSFTYSVLQGNTNSATLRPVSCAVLVSQT